jgi:hypothetical protein
VASTLCWTSATSVHAAPAVAPEAAPPPVKHLHRLGVVRVRGNERLARSILAAEDEFFGLYNALNRDDDYYISCGHTKIKADVVRRQCGARFVPDDVAVRSYGAGTCSGIVHGCSGVGLAFHTAHPSEAIPPAFMERPNTFRNNLLKVINGDPVLLRKYHHLLGLYRQMDANQQQDAQHGQ